MHRMCEAWEGGSGKEGELGATRETQISEHPLFPTYSMW